VEKSNRGGGWWRGRGGENEERIEIKKSWRTQ